MSRGATPETGNRPRFGERLRAIRSKRYEEWWHVVFLGPIGTFVAAIVAEVQWITPNAITFVSLVGRLAACALIVQQRLSTDVAAVVLIQVSGVLDVMDGSLARYRKRPSYEGAFLDKITDSISLSAFLFAAGYRAYLDSTEVWPILAAALMATTFAARSHMYWLVKSFEREAREPRTPSGASQGWGHLTLGGRWRYYASQTHLLFVVAAAEVYLAISIGLLAKQLVWTLYVLAALTSIWYVITLVARYMATRTLDRERRAATTSVRDPE